MQINIATRLVWPVSVQSGRVGVGGVGSGRRSGWGGGVGGGGGGEWVGEGGGGGWWVRVIGIIECDFPTCNGIPAVY